MRRDSVDQSISRDKMTSFGRDDQKRRAKYDSRYQMTRLPYVYGWLASVPHFAAAGEPLTRKNHTSKATTTPAALP